MKNPYDEVLEEFKGLIETDGFKNLRHRNRACTPVAPIKMYSNKDIKRLREQGGFTQTYFGEMLGVSIKTIQSWEAGTNKPTGTALRFLQVLEQNPHALDQYILLKA